MEKREKAVLEVLGGHHPAADEVGLDMFRLIRARQGPTLRVRVVPPYQHLDVGRAPPVPVLGLS